MSGGPLVPARIEFDADGQARAPDFGDVYHPRIGAAAQARHVFLQGNRLPTRWAGADHFTILETGFGLGNNFLATWDAWRKDPQRPGHLHYAAIEAHPPTVADLRRVHAGSPWPEAAAALVAAWPPLTRGLHAIDLDRGRVRLLLAFGDAQAMQRELDLGVDAFYLDGFAPDRNPAMWQRALLQALARKARAGATAATWSVAGEVTGGLRAAGFEVHRAPGIGGKREVTHAVFAPRPTMRPTAIRQAAAGDRHALIVGAGLAGAWAAEALAAIGWSAPVLDRRAEPAQEASGHPAGLFHATVHADDGLHARFHRAAAITAARALRPWIADGAVPGAADGLLRIAADGDTLEAMQTRIESLGLPGDFVRALSPAQASAAAGMALSRPAWCFADAGWVDPGALVRHLLHRSGARFVAGRAVESIQRVSDRWRALGADGRTIESGAVLVLANGADALRLWPQGGWPIGRSRGQVSVWASAPQRLGLPLAGDGYAIGLPDGRLLFGATAQPGDLDPQVRVADHAFNLQRLARLTGWAADPSVPWTGRTGWRAQTPDRLPIVGAVADAATGDSRVPGLFVLTALGSRGLTWAPLAARVLAAWIGGTMMPVEARLRDAVDPARWQRRAARRRA